MCNNVLCTDVAGDVAALLSFALARNRGEAVEVVGTEPATDSYTNTYSSSSSSSSGIVRSKDEILLQAVVPGVTTSAVPDGECLTCCDT